MMALNSYKCNYLVMMVFYHWTILPRWLYFPVILYYQNSMHFFTLHLESPMLIVNLLSVNKRYFDIQKDMKVSEKTFSVLFTVWIQIMINLKWTQLGFGFYDKVKLRVGVYRNTADHQVSLYWTSLTKS